VASKQGEEYFCITLRGIVQGVGFRPFVYRQAIRFGIAGKVWNQNGDVIIWASGKNFFDFLESVKQNNPTGSKIESITVTPVELYEMLAREESDQPRVLKPGALEGFTIADSAASGQNEPRFFPPDIAMCELCRAEIFAQKNRRVGHYFNNCIICGPRFSVLKAFPYDRANTAMGVFPLCKNCLNEYNSPEDLRFHAETVCCHQCGPTLFYKRGNELYSNNEAFAEAMRDLPGGIAIKGIGGYHLACCPYDAAAVQNLRMLKARDSKPFALMFRDIAAISRVCEISKEEEKLLISPARPIVLLKMKNNPFPWEVLGDTGGRCGCFLPYTPLQDLLLAENSAEIPCLVMTSANLSSLPMITDDQDILALTGRSLYHNREIVRGVEDSVMQIAAGKPQLIRRGRGFVPLPISVASQDIAISIENDEVERVPRLRRRRFCAMAESILDGIVYNTQLLAIGGDLKASFGLLKQQNLIQSQPFGDLEDELAFRQFEQGLADFENLFAFKPEAIVCDAHPRYFSSVLAKKIATERRIPLIPVYHHHAHIASVMAEHRLSHVLGVALDGAGYGTDGNIWGGEFLICEGRDCRRVGHLAYTKVIGADTAAKDAAKTAECYLYACGLDSIHPERAIIEAALEHNVNTIHTSSMGRLFDAVAALLAICQTNSYEGECAALLQYKAEEEEEAGIPPLDMHFDIQIENGVYVCHFRDVLQKCQLRTPGAALGFHNAASHMITEICTKICDSENIKDVALSGGVFQNSLLMEKVSTSLISSGLSVFTNGLVPPNDGGLALGQAFVGVNSRLLAQL